MTTEQKLYAIAKAQFDSIKAERQALVATIPAEADDYCERVDSVEEETGYWLAYDTLLKAEVALVAWARGVIQTDPKVAKRYAEVAIAFDKWQTYPALRPKMVDICFRLAA